MQIDSEPKYPFGFNKKQKILPFSPATTVGIYTVLTILGVMKQQLGLEAMLDYINKYIYLIEQTNPETKHAVQRALTLISVEGIYNDAMRSNNE